MFKRGKVETHGLIPMFLGYFILGSNFISFVSNLLSYITEPKNKGYKIYTKQCSNLTVVYSSKTSKNFQKLVVFFVPPHYCLKNEIYCIHSLLRSLLTCILLRIQTTKMARLDVLGGIPPKCEH